MQRPALGWSVPGFLLLVAGLCGAEAPDASLVNEEVKRTVDLSSHLAKITAEILLANQGASPAHSFVVALEPELAGHLAFVGVTVKGEEEEDSALELQETTVRGQSGRFFRAQLPSALAGGARLRVAVETVFTHVLRPFPTRITQAERQLVVFEGSHYLYSPYATRAQSTRVRLASKTVESYTKLGSPSRSEEVIEYGPFRDVAPYSQDAMKIHYENNSPFLTISSLTRTIEVSHWGNIAVEETVDLRHTGATLRGPFSRYDYQRQSDSGVSSIKSFKTILPAAAQDVYYRDEIGNISTSHLLVLEDSVEMEIRPRFPLFGGWKTHYIIGYNLPSYEYLYTLGDQYALKMRLVDHVFDDQVMDSLTLKIILPEGARNIHVDTPYPIDRIPDQLHYTYLDTFGRPVVVATKTNLVEQHIQDMVVHYTFNKILMLQEPLLVVGAFYILFFTVIVYVRLDFSITKDPAAEVRMKVASITEQVLTLVNRRLGLYRHFDEAVNKYKQSRDSGALNSGRKTLEAEHRALTNEIASLQARLKAEGSDLADKVTPPGGARENSRLQSIPDVRPVTAGCSALPYGLPALQVRCRESRPAWSPGPYARAAASDWTPAHDAMNGAPPPPRLLDPQTPAALLLSCSCPSCPAAEASSSRPGRSAQHWPLQEQALLSSLCLPSSSSSSLICLVDTGGTRPQTEPLHMSPHPGLAAVTQPRRAAPPRTPQRRKERDRRGRRAVSERAAAPALGPGRRGADSPGGPLARAGAGLWCGAVLPAATPPGCFLSAGVKTRSASGAWGCRRGRWCGSVTLRPLDPQRLKTSPPSPPSPHSPSAARRCLSRGDRRQRRRTMARPVSSHLQQAWAGEVTDRPWLEGRFLSDPSTLPVRLAGAGSVGLTGSPHSLGERGAVPRAGTACHSGDRPAGGEARARWRSTGESTRWLQLGFAL
nr:PREDICTED: dolichyl-diphosphooligosaccharide--protein glycosyltransferase subunit 1 [Lepisosteus oculatus]